MSETTILPSLDKLSWRDHGCLKPMSRLSTDISIGGTMHHIDAFQMEEVGGRQQVVNHDHEGVFNLLMEAFDIDLSVQTVEIKGLSYALFVSPYST